MKLKYIIPSLMAVVAAVFTGCSDDDDPTYLNELRVSQSYIGIPAIGGTVTIEATFADSLFVTDVPAWLSVTPDTIVEPGTAQITFQADAATDTREATVKLISAGKTQLINVVQQTIKADLPISTCQEVIDGPDSKTYRIQGVCTSIANTTYGNWYLQDETGSVYIYGTLDSKGGTKNFLSWGLEVGDIVTVEGPKTTYGSTVELVDVTVISIEKSLITVDSLSIENGELAQDGGDITAYVTSKGNAISVEIPEDAKDWLFISAINVKGVTFHALPNTGSERSTTITFVTSDGKKEYSSQTTIVQKGAIVDATIAEFLAAEVGNAQYRLTGVIANVANAGYGNVYIRDYSGEVYVYGIGAKGDFESLGLKEGDIVTIVGKRAEYKGSAQVGGAVFEKAIPVTEVTIDEFLEKEDSKDVYYKVTGSITSIENETYGNLHITSDSGESLYVYGCYPGYGATGDNRKGFLATANIEVGDLLTVIGYKTTYNGTIELAGGIYFSHVKPEPTPED